MSPDPPSLKPCIPAALIRDLENDLEADVTLAAPLAPLTWYRLGGPAEALVTPHTIEAAAQIIRRCQESNVPLRVLGGGANLLVSDRGVRGVVMRLAGDPWTTCRSLNDAGEVSERHDDIRFLRVGAGFDLFRLTQHAARLGLAGPETIAGVPGTIGGAIRMNAGGVYGDIGSITDEVVSLDGAGTIHHRAGSDAGFAYRHCGIDDPLIVESTLKVTPDSPDTVAARRKTIFAEKKAAQPMGDKSCGCVFKNPTLATRPYPEATAGRLIDEAGLKGFSVGGATISPVHANFVAADPARACAADVIGVIEHARRVVHDRTGVTLKTEIVIWQDD